MPNYLIKLQLKIKKYSMDQYLFISSNFILIQSKGKGDSFCYDYEVKKANKPITLIIKANIDKQTFYDMAFRSSKYILTNKITPSLIRFKYGAVQFQTAVYAYAKLIDYSKKNKQCLIM